ncbi:MAG: agmatinase [Syntrophaceae bacterium]|nr:agmatinase [Syntrophaceae bacterium]
MNFGGLDPEFCALGQSAFVVIPVPYDLTSTYQSGSRRGPLAILEASGNMELYDEELDRETYRSGIHTAPAIEADASGPESMVLTVRERVEEVLDLEKIPVLLGGEHSVSLGAVQAVRRKYPGLSVLQLDAHADLRDAYQGTPFSHACIARRIVELCPLVQAGIRSMSAPEALYLKDSGIRSFSADFVMAGEENLDRISELLEGDLYITVDLDALDPAFMPATGTPEPGGIDWRALTGLLRRVSRRARIRGFDVVELSPLPGLVAPDFLAAKLVYRMMGYAGLTAAL